VYTVNSQLSGHIFYLELEPWLSEIEMTVLLEYSEYKCMFY